MKITKVERQRLLKETIEDTPFITDEELAKIFSVSIQTIRLDRMELAIPELRERIKTVATFQWNETVKALPLDEVIGEIIDLELDKRAISILVIKEEHVFSRNNIARGHHLFAQANSLAVAVIDDELALTAKSELKFTRQVKEGERVVAKAFVEEVNDNGLTTVRVDSFVDNEVVFTGLFHMYRSNEQRGDRQHENSN
ncbi:transcription factor FapR [Virgibacillus ndiopensis]|uniref:transcription factor FapR n=1 Tax=Virgibacillus ndiopensis TaxID=2004408 RepID=UPI000C087A09|nr:transcription factor FapR [Virgibacillus ndiopensis]